MLQHLKVLRNRWAGNGKRAGQLVDGQRATGEPLKDCHPCAVGQGV